MDWKSFLQTEQIPFEENVDLKKKTWIHRGGIAGLYVIPDNMNQLIRLVSRLYQEKAAFKIVGHTSNLYIRNTTNLDIVISTIHLNNIQEGNGQYICECGVAMTSLSRQAIENGHAGYEGFVNLPGTVASAAVNNAGCFQCSISNLLIEAKVLCPDGEIRTITKETFAYSERSSAFKRGEQQGVILSVTLDCSAISDQRILQEKAEANTLYRKTRQEGPKQNLGSTYPIYVMQAFYKNLPFFTRLCLRIFSKLYYIAGSKMPQHLVNTIILLSYGNYCTLHRYVSKHNFGCFVWRDENADKAFDKYKTLIAKTSGIPDIEIEII